jgi:sugar phosphate permease
MVSLTVGYAAFYWVRQNFSIAIASDKFPFDVETIGWGFSVFSIVYGVCKFVSGALCDRSSARYFMPIGLVGAAVTSLLAGCMPSAFLIGLMYAFNACFQSMGWPSISRTLTQWFGPDTLGVNWGIVNASHQVGSIVILAGGALLVERYTWRHVFIVPAIVCLVVAAWLWNRLRDTPQSIGLPSVEEYEGIVPLQKSPIDEPNEDFWTVMREHIVFNYRLWMVCIANFFVYFVRMGYFFWAPKIIAETQGGRLIRAGSKSSILEFAGLIGGLFVGWFTDKFMPNRRGACGAYMMIFLSIVIGLYWIVATRAGEFLARNESVDVCLWALVGFLVYGPQMLGGLSAAEFGSKKAAAGAAGLTGTIGYLGASVVGIGVPKMAKAWGWESVYISFIIASLLGGIFFTLTCKSSEKSR